MCGEAKPSDQFKLVRQGSITRRMRRCISCRLIVRRARNGGKKRAKSRQAVNGLVKQLKTARIEVPHISELASGIIQRFGGLDRFCERWLMQIETTLALNPASRAAMDCFRDVSHLVVQSTVNRQTAPDVQELSDEEMAQELNGHMAHLLRADPELARNVMGGLGLSVVRDVDLIEAAPAKKGDPHAG